MKKKKDKRGGKRPGAGRPATGRDPLRGVRMPEKLYSAILRWAKSEPDHPTFAEAVRRLVTKALGI